MWYHLKKGNLLNKSLGYLVNYKSQTSKQGSLSYFSKTIITSDKTKAFSFNKERNFQCIEIFNGDYTSISCSEYDIHLDNDLDYLFSDLNYRFNELELLGISKEEYILYYSLSSFMISKSWTINFDDILLSFFSHRLKLSKEESSSKIFIIKNYLISIYKKQISELNF